MGILFRWEQHFTEHRFNNMIWRDLTKLSSSTTGFHMTFTGFYQTIVVWWESYRRRRIDNLEEFWRPHWTFISRFCWLNPHVLLLKSLLFSWRNWHPPMILLLNSLFAAFNFIDSFSWISIVLWWNHLESICIQVVPRVFPLCSPCLSWRSAHVPSPSLREALLRNAAHEEAVGEDVFIALQRSSISDYY